MKLKKTIIIAEAGVNHNGNIDYAKKLVLLAKKSGVDFIKFQSFEADNIIKKNTPLVKYQKQSGYKSQYQLLKSLQLSEQQQKIIFNFCKKNKIKFLSTPFDIDSCKLLKRLGLKIIKISSGDINNYPLLIEVSKFAKKVILSTGMSNLIEIKNAINILKKNNLKDKDIIVLHCTTGYPVPYNEANILTIKFLKKNLKNLIGFSDHTLGIEAAIAAVSLGAVVIEKHITLDKNLPGPDHKASLEPLELMNFVKVIRRTELILGSYIKVLSKSEKKNKFLIRKSVVAKTNIKKGQIFTAKNITVKRPEGGLSPIHWKKIIGKKATRNFNYDDFIIIR